MSGRRRKKCLSLRTEHVYSDRSYIEKDSVADPAARMHGFYRVYNSGGVGRLPYYWTQGVEAPPTLPSSAQRKMTS